MYRLIIPVCNRNMYIYTPLQHDCIDGITIAMKAGHNTDDHITQFTCESTEYTCILPLCLSVWESIKFANQSLECTGKF